MNPNKPYRKTRKRTKPTKNLVDNYRSLVGRKLSWKERKKTKSLKVETPKIFLSLTLNIPDFIKKIETLEIEKQQKMKSKNRRWSQRRPGIITEKVMSYRLWSRERKRRVF